MKQIISYLNSENSIKLGDKTVGTLLCESKCTQLYSERTQKIDTIVLHYMSNCIAKPQSPFETEDLLQIFVTYGVSAHYLIQRDGTIYNLVPPVHKAWHAGGSIMPAPDNRVGVNDFSIGIELAGGEFAPFTEAQYESLRLLIKEIAEQFSIQTILGHEDIAGERAVTAKIRKDVKIDPGPQFDWEKLQKALPVSLSQAIKHGN